jgi:hypothetical protein
MSDPQSFTDDPGSTVCIICGKEHPGVDICPLIRYRQGTLYWGLLFLGVFPCLGFGSCLFNVVNYDNRLNSQAGGDIMVFAYAMAALGIPYLIFRSIKGRVKK